MPQLGAAHPKQLKEGKGLIDEARGRNQSFLPAVSSRDAGGPLALEHALGVGFNLTTKPLGESGGVGDPALISGGAGSGAVNEDLDGGRRALEVRLGAEAPDGPLGDPAGVNRQRRRRDDCCLPGLGGQGDSRARGALDEVHVPLDVGGPLRDSPTAPGGPGALDLGGHGGLLQQDPVLGWVLIARLEDELDFVIVPIISSVLGQVVGVVVRGGGGGPGGHVSAVRRGDDLGDGLSREDDLDDGLGDGLRREADPDVVGGVSGGTRSLGSGLGGDPRGVSAGGATVPDAGHGETALEATIPDGTHGETVLGDPRAAAAAVGRPLPLGRRHRTHPAMAADVGTGS